MEYTAATKRSRILMGRDSSFLTVEVQRIVSALSQAVTVEQRRIGLYNLFSYLSYDNEKRSFEGGEDLLEDLVKAGALQALCLQLSYVMNGDRPEEEIMCLCQAVDLVYHCSRSTRERSLRDVGPDLFSILLRAVWRCKRANTIREVIAIWHTCSGGIQGATMVLRFPGILDSLVKVLQEDGTDSSCADAKNEALGVVKNLSYYAEDYRLNLLQHPGMLTSLTRTATLRSKKLMARLSAVLRNLAGAPNTRIVLARNQDTLNAIIALSMCPHPRTTRNMLSTVLSLAMDTHSCILLVTHGEGILLDVLARLVQDDKNAVLRRRAARAIRLLARNKGMPLIFHETALIDALGKSAMNDESHDVRFEAAEAFVCCTESIQAQMPHHQRVLETLMGLATRQTVVPDIVTKALKEKAGCPSNRVSMANHSGLLSALCEVAVSELSSMNAKEYAICTLMDLSDEESNRETMATEVVLVALVKSILDARDESSRVRRNAARAMANLASLASNRKRMVTYSGLLNGLVQVAATSPDAKTKSAVKEVIMLLVPVL